MIHMALKIKKKKIKRKGSTHKRNNLSSFLAWKQNYKRERVRERKRERERERDGYHIKVELLLAIKSNHLSLGGKI